MTKDNRTRIALIHALTESVLPAHQAFRSLWPEAYVFDLLDTSLSADLAAGQRLEDGIADRIRKLADYAAASKGEAGETQALLFTCSAFGPAIDAVKNQIPIPVLRPNEAAFEQALDLGSRIGLAVTFGPSFSSLRDELLGMASERGQAIEVVPVLVEGALAALKAGNGSEHDRLAAEACRRLPALDALVLGQFSLARAADAVRDRIEAPVLTTPSSAVAALKNLTTSPRAPLRSGTSS
ncbi:MAG: aspartate/glutamate racemase family protein [Rhizobium sp.]|nr:aspartate/glutamate racemase family protein [Rhizobium sp.]